MPNYKCECPAVFGGDDAQRDRDIHMDSCEFVKIRKERDALLLQIDALKKEEQDTRNQYTAFKHSAGSRITELEEERKLLMAHIEQDQTDLERVTEEVERWQESNAYDHQKMDEFAREFFGDQEGKTWAAGFTLWKLLEMARDEFFRRNEAAAKASNEVALANRLNLLYKSALDWIFGYAHIRGFKDIEVRCEEVFKATEKRETPVPIRKGCICGPDGMCDYHRVTQ